MKEFLFFTMDGFTYDKANNQTHNMQILGDGMGTDVYKALMNFKHNQKYITLQSYTNVLAVQTVGDVITNLEL